MIGNAYVNGDASSSSISLAEMDDMLFDLSEKSKEKEKLKIVKNILDKLRSCEEVINFIRLVIGKLRMTSDMAHAGLGNATLERLHDEMKDIMGKSGIEEGKSFKLVKSLAMKPDYIVKDPKKAPV